MLNHSLLYRDSGVLHDSIYSIVDKSVALVANQNKVSTEKFSKLKKDLAKRKIIDNKVYGERCQDSNLLYKSFKKLGLYVLSDKLQFGTACDTLVDVTGQGNRKDIDELELFDFRSDYECIDRDQIVFDLRSESQFVPFLVNPFVPKSTSFDESGNNGQKVLELWLDKMF